jgi:hypothetical protein
MDAAGKPLLGWLPPRRASRAVAGEHLIDELPGQVPKALGLALICFLSNLYTS